MTLHRETVTDDTWSTLSLLMMMPALKRFALVRGTNLSLRFGHRISNDIDLFVNESFDEYQVWKAINKEFPNALKLGQSEQTLWLNIDGLKLDLILYEYPVLKPIEEFDGIRLFSVEDVAAMKLTAVATRGVKKDFWDIATLLNHYSLSEMIEFYRLKYKSADVGHIILSLTYFNDAEKETLNPLDIGGMSWPMVKDKIRYAVKSFVDSQ